MTLNIQSQLDNKQKLGDYVTTTTLDAIYIETELQGEIVASATAITTAYTAADVVVASAAAALLSAASTSLQTQIALKQDKSAMSSYATQSWVNSQNYLTS